MLCVMTHLGGALDQDRLKCLKRLFRPSGHERRSVAGALLAAADAHAHKVDAAGLQLKLKFEIEVHVEVTVEVGNDVGVEGGTERVCVRECVIVGAGVGAGVHARVLGTGGLILKLMSK
jgi:hypothetical protein